MKRSSRLFMLIGIILSLVVFVLVLNTFGRPGGQGGTGQQGGGQVVVANKDLALGETLTADNVTTKSVDASDPAATSAYRDPKEVQGLVVRRSIRSGQVITPQDFGQRATAQNADVVSALSKGLRAIAVQVDQITGVGTLIQPGDRVDVILALSDSDAKFPQVFPKGRPDPNDLDVGRVPDDFFSGTTVKVLVQNAQVLGTLLPPPTEESGQGGDQGGEGQPRNEQGTALTGQKQIVILAVTPQQAELVRFTQLDGNLSLVLRSPDDKATAPAATTGVTLARLISEHGVLKPDLMGVTLPAK